MIRAVWLPLLLASWVAAPASGSDYRIDKAHSHAEFSVRMLWVHHVGGRFNDINGEVTLNPLRDTAVVEATVDVNSVAMSSSRLRRWVLDPEFFDVRRFPTIHFISAPLGVRALDQGGDLPGLLTLRGITRAVHFRLEPADCTLQANTVCSIVVRGEVKRSDYGMTTHSTAVADTVELGLLITLAPASR